jgi:Co/Zn/Cd efflux system component
MAHDHSHDDDHSGHDHGHDHSHGHHHHPVPKDFSRAFLIGILLNVSFVGVEAVYGFFSDSLSLLADAGHNLGDVLGLALAWGAAYLSKKRATDRYSYGLKSSSIMAALINASILLVAVGAIILEPVVSIVVSIVILMGTFGLLKESVNLSLHAVPEHIDLNEVRDFLLKQTGVCEVHDLHVWAMSTTEVAMTCHLATKDPSLFCANGRLQKISDEIDHKFQIVHSTIQVDHEADIEHCVKDLS